VSRQPAAELAARWHALYVGMGGTERRGRCANQLCPDSRVWTKRAGLGILCLGCCGLWPPLQPPRMDRTVAGRPGHWHVRPAVPVDPFPLWLLSELPSVPAQLCYIPPSATTTTTSAAQQIDEIDRGLFRSPAIRIGMAPSDRESRRSKERRRIISE
jgi:hypothetical protein